MCGELEPRSELFRWTLQQSHQVAMLAWGKVEATVIEKNDVGMGFLISGDTGVMLG